jgi:peptidoglycan/xylan/chitin deacetylase (PgdA/CDA1 family)
MHWTKRVAGRLADLTLPVHEPLDRRISPLLGRNRLMGIASHLYGDEPASVVRAKLRMLGRKFDFLPIGEALERLTARALPPRAAVFIVDDVTTGFCEQCFPLLRESGIPFTLAPIPGLIPANEKYHFIARVMRVAGTYPRSCDEIRAAWGEIGGAVPPFDSYATLFAALETVSIATLEALQERLAIPVDAFASWADLRQMIAESGCSVASHSMSHPMMGRAEGAWLEWEVGTSRRLLEQQLGVRVCDFIFPVGAAADSTVVVQHALAAHGYRSGFLVGNGLISSMTNPYQMPRVGFEKTIGLLNLATSMAFLRLVRR